MQYIFVENDTFLKNWIDGFSTQKKQQNGALKRLVTVMFLLRHLFTKHSDYTKAASKP